MGALIAVGAVGFGCGPRSTEPSEAPVSSPVAAEPTPLPSQTDAVEPTPADDDVAAGPEAVEPPAEEVAPPDEPSDAVAEVEALPEKLWKDDLEPRIVAVQPIVAAAAAEHGVDPHLVNGVIWVESKFDRKAKNRSGARGLMQLMPKTAKSIGRSLGRPAKVYDADFNVHAGTWYLSRLLAKFDGDERLALASYVRGPAKIRAWVAEDHPFPDGVVGFVEKVQRARRVFAALGWPAESEK